MRHCRRREMSVQTTASISTNEVEWHYQTRTVVIWKATPALIILTSYYFNPLTSLILMIHWLDSGSKIPPNQMGPSDWKKLLPASYHLWHSLLLDHWQKLTWVGFPYITSLNRTFFFGILLFCQSIFVLKMQQGPHMLEGDELRWPTETHRKEFNLETHTPVLHSAFYTIYWNLMFTHSNSNKVRHNRRKYLQNSTHCTHSRL